MQRYTSNFIKVSRKTVLKLCVVCTKRVMATDRHKKIKIRDPSSGSARKFHCVPLTALHVVAHSPMTRIIHVY